MGNSVLDNTDFEDYLSELELSVSGYKTGGKFTVFVEGIDDTILYEKFFNQDRVIVSQTEGVSRLTEIVGCLDRHGLENYFIAIKDSDYDRINCSLPSYDNLFLTDKHDLETTIISVAAVEMLLKENLRYADIKKEKVETQIIDGEALIVEACDMLLDISYIRWYNNEYDKNINFDVLKFQDVLSTYGALDCKSCLKYLLDNPCNKSVNVTSEDINAFKADHGEIDDVFQLVRGHDLCEVLYILIKKNRYYRQKSNLSSDKIEMYLRSGFSKEQFRSTELYSNVKSYFDRLDYSNMFAC